MKPPELGTFIRERMKMSHVYQPLLLRTLLESGGAATVRQIARVFAAADEAQVQFYERRIRQMPLRVLKRHKVVRVEGDLVQLDVSGITFAQQSRLIADCNQKIADFLISRGRGVWTGMIQLEPVSETVRYRVIARDRTCRLCGAGPDDSPLEVDHIVPRSKGGGNGENNLQVLCRPCNRGKSNLDDIDFR